MNTTEFDFDTPVARRGTDSAKWQKYSDRDIIPMWVADMDFQSPPAVVEALHDRIEHGIFGYGTIQPSVTEAILAYLERDFCWNVEPSWLVWLPGVVSGLNVACRCIGHPGDSVMTAVPVYPPFLTAPRHSQRRLVTTQLVHSDQHWQFDFDDLERSMHSSTSMFMLCNPQNPTGRIFNRDELIRLARICSKHDAIICSDEIHCDLTLEPDRRHIPMASISDEIAQKTITLMAPSKSYNIPGLGCSFAVIPNHRIRRRFKNAMAGIMPYVNTLGLVAARAAYNNGRPWLEAVKKYLRGNHDLVMEAINAMDGLSMTPSEATYLAWIDARDLNIPDPGGFFEHAGIGLSNGIDFKGPGYVRLNFACPRSQLTQAMGRMHDAVTAHGP